MRAQVVPQLSAAVTVIRVTTLVPNNQNAKPGIVLPVDDGVREVGQRMDSAAICRRRSNVWMLLKQPRDAFKLSEESPGKSDSCFALIKPNCLSQVFRCEPVNGPTH